MSDDDEIPEAPPASMPGWVMTFADLMSLLMCFFVLLLSFSEMDLQKFKQVAGSMEKAFGVQRQIKARETPRGTSIIAQEFSPGKPDPTTLNEVRQEATMTIGDLLQIDQEGESKTEAKAKEVAQELIEEVKDGRVEVETKDDKIIIRILEESSFSSGSATIEDRFLPVIDKISRVLLSTPGSITISGFTDNIPIATDLFRSNWELSAARAVSVTEELLKNEAMDARRFVISGYGENRPLATNSTPEGRAKNRRVEIMVNQGEIYEYAEEDVIGVGDESDLNELEKIRKAAEEDEPGREFVPVLDEDDLKLVPVDSENGLTPEEVYKLDQGISGELKTDEGLDFKSANPFVEGESSEVNNDPTGRQGSDTVVAPTSNNSGGNGGEDDEDVP